MRVQSKEVNPSQVKQAPLAIWPNGPAAGVYVADRVASVNLFVRKYAEASGGAIYFSDDAELDRTGRIQLVEGGMRDDGLARLPSGTLLVHRLLSDDRIWQLDLPTLTHACCLARDHGYRVVVLVQTQFPSTVCADIRKAVEGCLMPELAETVRGQVSESGVFVEVPYRGTPPEAIANVASYFELDPIPAEARQPLAQALEGKSAGVVLVGSTADEPLGLANVCNAVLEMTTAVGPAAQVGNLLGAPPFGTLPVMDSIDNAIAHGFRRIVLQLPDFDGSSLSRCAGQAMFICSARERLAMNLPLEFGMFPLETSPIGQHLIAAFSQSLTVQPTSIVRSLDLLTFAGGKVEASKCMLELLGLSRLRKVIYI